MNEREAGLIAATVQASFPRHPWPSSTVAHVVDELTMLGEFAAIYPAVRSFLRWRWDGEFPPSPGALVRGIAAEAIRPPDFDEAWAEVLEAASTCEYFSAEPPAFSHMVVGELARKIGWTAIRMSTAGDTYLRHSAEKVYAAVVQRAISREVEMPSLGAGDVEARFAELVDGIGRGLPS